MANISYRSRPISNLIQGVSQQVPQQRRDTQCEEQFDCINSPILGVVARPGADVLSFRSGVARPGAFTYELRRGLSEHYLMVLFSGTLEVYDLNTGNLCSVTDSTGGDGYLSSASGVMDVDNFRVQTVSDATFITNRSKVPAYTGARTPTRPPEALVFFQAGNYSQTYIVAVTYLGTTYRFQYVTPDNSVAGNMAYIFTNQLAATFYRAMTGAAATSYSSDGTGGNMAGDAGGSGAGAHSVVTSPVHLQDLGFTVGIQGNLLHIWRASDTNAFTVDVSDGAGGTSITAFMGTVPSFSQLPEGGFDGMALKVVGVNASAGTSSGGYWVKFTGDVAGGGTWVECPAPGSPTTLDPSTMPHQIFCSAVNTFVIQRVSWMPRVCGDAVNTGLDPGFVGKPIVNLSFYQQRLAVLTESTVDFSVAGQVYTFFPATVQASLATGPISLIIAASDTTALLRAAVVVDESFTLWSQLAQFRINSGIQPFQPDTVQNPQSTCYEFNEGANFSKMGSSVVFSYEASNFATVLNLQYTQGRAQGDTDITAHVQAYIPKGVRQLAMSTTMNTMFVRTDGASSCLYLYNYLNEGSTVVQSAWNVWRLPSGSILWQAIYRQTLYILHQRADGVALLTVPLNLSITDNGQPDYLTRLDMRVSEASCSSVYDGVSGNTTITFPYAVQPSEFNLVRVAARTSGVTVRGRLATIVSQTGNTVTVAGDWSSQAYYLGMAIASSRKESEFFLRTASGAIPTESLKVKNFVVDVQGCGYSRIDIVQGSGQTKRAEFFPVPSGQSVVSLGAPPALGTGQLKIACDTESKELSVTITNDSHLPSRWTASEWQFISVERPNAMLAPTGGPVT